MEERTKFHVGLDVHKDSISVAAAELGRAPARLIGKVTHPEEFRRSLAADVALWTSVVKALGLKVD
jgi:hypothetical protein